LPVVIDATSASPAILLGLNQQWIDKQADFWIDIMPLSDVFLQTGNLYPCIFVMGARNVALSIEVG